MNFLKMKQIKKPILTCLVASISLFASAQANVSFTLDSPVVGANLTSGTSFNYDFTLTNTGTEPIDILDTIIVLPTVNGNRISSNSGGFVDYVIIGIAIAANGGSSSFSKSLTVQGGTAGNVEFCGISGVFGQGWTNVTESNTDDNEDCNTVNWSIPVTVGIEDLSLATLQDNSFYNRGIFNVRLLNAGAFQSMKFELINLTGKVVQSSDFEVSNQEVVKGISLNSPSKGIYIARLSSKGKVISTRKIVVQ